MPDSDKVHLRTLDEIRGKLEEVKAEQVSTRGLTVELSPVELDEIRQRMERATEGPWLVHRSGTGIRSGGEYVFVGPKDDATKAGILALVELTRAGTVEDADFIAHARQDVLRLVDTVTNKTRRIAKLFNEVTTERQAALRGVQFRDRLSEELSDAKQKIRELETSYTMMAQGVQDMADRNNEYIDSLKARLAEHRRELASATEQRDAALREVKEQVQVKEAEGRMLRARSIRLDQIRDLVNSDATTKAIDPDGTEGIDWSYLRDVVRDLRRLLA